MTARYLYICRHEAAHAVVGVYLGLQITGVMIGTYTYKGRECVGGTDFMPPGRQQRLAFGVMLAAGPAADQLYHTSDNELGGIDRRYIIGAGWGPEDFRPLIISAKAYLKGPLKAPWRELSDTLRERDVTGAEVRQIVRGLR